MVKNSKYFKVEKHDWDNNYKVVLLARDDDDGADDEQHITWKCAVAKSDGFCKRARGTGALRCPADFFFLVKQRLNKKYYLHYKNLLPNICHNFRYTKMSVYTSIYEINKKL